MIICHVSDKAETAAKDCSMELDRIYLKRRVSLHPDIQPCAVRPDPEMYFFKKVMSRSGSKPDFSIIGRPKRQNILRKKSN